VTGTWRNTDREQKTDSMMKGLELIFGKYLVGTALENSMRLVRNKIQFLFSDSSCALDQSDGFDIDIDQINSGCEKSHWILKNRKKENHMSS